MALISVAEALNHVLAHAAPLPPEQAPLDDALGRVLAADLKALRTQPPADLSAMDGYAARASDVANVPVQLRVIGEVAAGRPFTTVVGAGEAARIFTGGVMPAGADTVVVQEITERKGDAVAVLKPVSKGRHIRRQGLDFKRGDTLFTAGHRLSARDLALLAGMNHPLLPLHRRPKVALFATGDELVPPGQEPGPGQIVYSNGFALAALARQEGAIVVDLGLVKDGSNRPWRLFARRAKVRPTFWSPLAAPRSVNTISFTRLLPPRAWTCRFGRSPCGRAGR